MSELKNPSDLAREALKRLAVRHLPPTPANFQACYDELAGVACSSAFPEGQLRELAGALTAHNAAQETRLASLQAAIGKRSWQGVREALVAFARAGNERSSAAVQLATLPPDFAGKLARFIECGLPALGDDNQRLRALAGELMALLQQPVVDVVAAQVGLANLTQQVLYAAEEQAEIKGSLLKLLHLIIANISQLSVDDHWLKGQVDGLLATVAPPLNLRHLDEMESRLREVMERQGRAKMRSLEAQAEMRQMLSEFIERLAEMHRSSRDFEGQIEASARQIEGVESIDDLRPLLNDLLAATQAMAGETAASRHELNALQDKVAATEAELVLLHQELDSASALARHDPLTDVLNRKGLEEALLREVSSMQRKESPLSISMLDIDNFKKLNDRLGHAAGDGALVHLVEVARRSMRPSDTLARYGGEEFVILMPDTAQAEGIEAMTRLQRELTKAFYLSGKERVLITFSAGVAQLGRDETGADAIRRADQAMYLAKRAGKNRVMGA